MNNETESKPPLMQRFFDNHWLLLVLGVLIPFLSYTVWGWIEIALVAPAPTP